MTIFQTPPCDLWAFCPIFSRPSDLISVSLAAPSGGIHYRRDIQPEIEPDGELVKRETETHPTSRTVRGRQKSRELVEQRSHAPAASRQTLGEAGNNHIFRIIAAPPNVQEEPRNGE